MQITRIKRQRAVDAVYDVLRERILSSHFQPGERLHLDELANKFGVSFTPVQHAIHQLAAEGLVEVRPRKGTFVTSLSAQDIEEAFEIRRVLECLAAETVVDRISETEVARLRKLMNTMARPIESRDDRGVHEQCNADFHLTMVRASGNRRLAEMYEDLYAHLHLGRVNLVSDEGHTRLAREQEEHAAIIAAIEQRDRSALIEAVRTHIVNGKAIMLASFDGTVDETPLSEETVA